MCSYCGCESIDVIGRFMAEHVEIVNASGVLRRACERGDAEAVVAAADALGRLLHPHTGAEEAGLFAVLSEDDEFTDHVRSLCAEHTSLDAALAAVRDGDHASFPAFDLALRAHIDREENGLFPAAAIAFAGPEWERVTALTPVAAARNGGA
ncbi:hemerythrin domain-containing protein [Fodinibacter luteus]|uniref:Hemerythrin domain-containing protein n=1 Tax=Fodinibacter luteus TaxID=552064 RepID=A0ABP8KDR8_9MICO